MITTMGWSNYISIVFITIPFFAFSQTNLVPNPSFELYTSCPLTPSQIILATPWFQPNNISSSDYYNSCSSSLSSSVPNNFGGYQNANSGQAYSAIAVFIGDTINQPNNYREYLEVELISNLSSGKTYCVEFYVSLANNSDYAIESIETLFSDTLITTTNFDNIYTSVQISNSSGIINDTVNWVKISGSFIASGNERYLLIGNFKQPGAFGYYHLQNMIGASYYYIDDVSVYLCDSSAINSDSIIIPNVFSPNQDDVNDLFLLENLPKGYEVIIYNRWGEIMQQFSHQGTEIKNTWYWDGYTQAGLLCPEGVYFYILKLPGQEDRKGTLTLIR